MRFTETQIARAITDLLEEKKGEEDRLVQDVLRFLRKKHLFRSHQKIMAALEREINARENIVQVTIVSARQLEASEQALVHQKVSEIFPGKRIALHYREQPSLIGGIALETDNACYDATLSRSLKLLSQSL